MFSVCVGADLDVCIHVHVSVYENQITIPHVVLQMLLTDLDCLF